MAVAALAAGQPSPVREEETLTGVWSELAATAPGSPQPPYSVGAAAAAAAACADGAGRTPHIRPIRCGAVADIGSR